MKRACAWAVMAVMVGCGDTGAKIAGPGLHATMDEGEGGPGIPDEEIPVHDDVPDCPTGLLVVYQGQLMCAGDVPPQQEPAFPGGPNGGSGNPSGPGGPAGPPVDQGEPSDESHDDAETKALIGQAKARARNASCTSSCFAKSAARLEPHNCLEFLGYPRPQGAECPFGSSSTNNDQCPGFFALCAFHNTKAFGEPAGTEACVDENGVDHIWDPACSVPVDACIADWNANFKPSEWLPCFEGDALGDQCLSTCFAAFPIDGAACQATTGGSTITGQMDGEWCDDGATAMNCSVMGAVDCTF